MSCTATQVLSRGGMTCNASSWHPFPGHSNWLHTGTQEQLTTTSTLPGRRLSLTSSSPSGYLLYSNQRLDLHTSAQLPHCLLERAISAGMRHHYLPILLITSLSNLGYGYKYTTVFRAKQPHSTKEGSRHTISSSVFSRVLGQSKGAAFIARKSGSTVRQPGLPLTSKVHGLFLRASATITAALKGALLICHFHFQGISGKHKQEAQQSSDLEMSEKTCPACLLLCLSLQQGYNAHTGCSSTWKGQPRELLRALGLFWAPESAGTRYTTF